ncbi:MAG: isochorismate synthase [Acidimicrobiales bacterium]
MRAVTRALEPGPPIDARRVAGDDGVYFQNERVTLAGTGRAAVLPLPRGLTQPAGWHHAEEWLAGAPRDDTVGLPGTGPVAFGALAFERGTPGELVVPSILYGRAADGTEWVTVVGDDGPEATRELLLESASPPRIEPTATVEVLESRPDYPSAVLKATKAIALGALRKVVLARRLVLGTAGTVVASNMLDRLHSIEPSSTAFLIGGRDGAFLGASPELLMSRRGRSVLSNPLAGTAPLGPDGGDQLLGSAKNLEEHEIVVADIAGVLDPRCSELVVPSHPALVELHTMAHLGTRIEGQLLEEDGRVPSALDLVAALHPTPAVGGVPRDPALGLIAKLEPGRRGRWAGPVGWLDADGDGDWMVGLRSAWLSGATAIVWAGAGIVAASDPESELAETEVKLVPVLEGLAPGSSALLGANQLRY